VFGKQAEICERFLAKGRLVGIEGRIQTGSYKDKDGRTVYTTDVIASNVHFLEFGERPPVQRREEYQDPQPSQESRRNHEQQYTFDDIEEPEDFAAIDEDIPF
jgi:single-strand DNA-binding protein